MRIFLYHLSGVLALYLIFAFVNFDMFWFTGSAWTRVGFILLTCAIQSVMATAYMGWLPNFLKTPTHEEKKSSIKKYIGELHEELALYWEAMELQRKIKEFKSKQ